MIIREEKPEDIKAIHQLNEKAFGGDVEANLVDKLRKNGKAALSLIAEENGKVVGHILFSPVTIESGGLINTMLSLGPMAVLPSLQKQGIGGLLVKCGLDLCRRAGHKGVVVLGHPEYYPRFGFVPASKFGIRCAYQVSDEVFMAFELYEGGLKESSGLVRYQPEFNEV